MKTVKGKHTRHFHSLIYGHSGDLADAVCEIATEDEYAQKLISKMSDKEAEALVEFLGRVQAKGVYCGMVMLHAHGYKNLV